MTKYGYLRVSSQEQRPDRQVDGLKGICDELQIEKLSAVSAVRPVFDGLIDNMQAGDTLVVWDLDRAFRSTIDAILTTEALQRRKISFQIVNLNIDTATPAGELLYTIMAAYAQFERRSLIQRTKEGMAAARKRGVRLGRPPKLSSCQIAEAKHRLKNGFADVQALADEFGVSIWTVERSLLR